MLKTLKNFFAFCGADNRRLFMVSIWLGVVSAICSAMRIPAAAIVIQALLQKHVTMATLWTSLGIIVASLIVTIAINMKATMLQTRAGYRACANKRIEIAEHLRYLPMGWFNDNSLGEVTSVTTNTMDNLSGVSTRVVMLVTEGIFSTAVMTLAVFLFDWRVGLFIIAGLAVYYAVNHALQIRSEQTTRRKFAGDTAVVEQVLESTGSIPIPEGKAVLTLNAKESEEALTRLRALQPGDTVTLTVSSSDQRWSQAVQALGGVSKLVTNGQVDSGLDASRTAWPAIGIKADGTVIFYAMDGKQPGYSVGATQGQVAQRLIELGCVEAICMDGGGSTTITATQPDDTTAATINRPSDGSERAVANHLFLVATNEPTSTSRRTTPTFWRAAR